MACPSCTPSILSTSQDADQRSIFSLHVNTAETVLAYSVQVPAEGGDTATAELRQWDIADKSSPVAGTELTLSNARNVVVGLDETVFVPAFTPSSGLRVVSCDIGTDPATQLDDLSLTTTGLSLLVQEGGICVSDDRLYVIDSSSLVTPGRLIRIVDVSNPSAMSELGTLTLNTGWSVNLENAQGIVADGDILYVVATELGGGDQILAIFDTSNVGAISQLGSCVLTSVVGQTIMSLLDGYVYLAGFGGASDQFFVIVDVNNTSSPSQVSDTDSGSATMRSLKPIGNVLYTGAVTGATAGRLKLWDVSDRGNPAECQTPQNGAIFPSTNSLFVTASHLYEGIESDDGVELNIWNVEDCNSMATPSDPLARFQVYRLGVRNVMELVSTLETTEFLTHMVLQGHYVYAISAGETQNLTIIDIKKPDDPEEVVVFDVGATTRGIHAQGRYITVACDGGVKIVDVTVPSAPVVTATAS